MIDWSVLAIAGDPDLDVALAAGYLGLTPTATDSDRTWARDWLAERELTEVARRYQRWGAAWWSPMDDDPRLRAWVADTLR